MKYSKFILPFLVIYSAHAVPSFEETNFFKKTTSALVDKNHLDFADALYQEKREFQTGKIDYYFLTQDEVSSLFLAQKFEVNSADELKKLMGFVIEIRDITSDIFKNRPEFFKNIEELADSVPDGCENPMDFVLNLEKLKNRKLEKILNKHLSQDDQSNFGEILLMGKIADKKAAALFQKRKKINGKILFSVAKQEETTLLDDVVAVKKKEKKPSMRRGFSDFFKNKSPKLSRQ